MTTDKSAKIIARICTGVNFSLYMNQLTSDKDKVLITTNTIEATATFFSLKLKARQTKPAIQINRPIQKFELSPVTTHRFWKISPTVRSDRQ